MSVNGGLCKCPFACPLHTPLMAEVAERVGNPHVDVWANLPERDWDPDMVMCDSVTRYLEIDGKGIWDTQFHEYLLNLPEGGS